MASSSSSTAGLVLPSRPKEPYLTVTCPYPQCRAQLEYLPPSASQVSTLPATEKTFKVTCSSCKGRFEPPNSARLLREARGGTAGEEKKSSAAKRRIGTDQRPLDLEYYDILGLSPTCTQDEVKKAYRKLAIKLHPDKNPDNPEVEEAFKKLATAYQVLSDPELRHKYNEFGASTPGLVPEDGFVDPEEVFGSLFGGGRFKDIVGIRDQIGTISIGKDMKEALQQDSEELERQAEAESDNGNAKVDGPEGSSKGTSNSQGLSPEAKAAKEEKERLRSEERAKQREERVTKLAEHLVRRLSVYTESVRGIGAGEEALKEEVKRSFREITRLEAEELKGESYGVELLHVVGFVYLSKSKHYLASSYVWGLGGMYHSLTSSAHIVSSTVSTVRAALELKNVFEELKKAEEAGITEDRKKELEEKAATKGMQALFKGASLEVESILREVCDRVLYPSPSTEGGGGEGSISKETQKLRAVALGIVGSVYTEVKAPTTGGIGAEDEYVKIDAKAR